MAKTKKPKVAKATTPTSVTITYDLFDLPTAQHKAGLAGLLLQIESMKNRGAQSPTYHWDVDQPNTTVHVTFSEATTEALFDDLYDAALIEGEPREKPLTKGKGAAKQEVTPIRRVSFSKTDKKGKEKIIEGYVYWELTPSLATLRHYLPKQGEWVRLWRDLIWQIIREGKKKAPYIKRAASKVQPQGVVVDDDEGDIKVDEDDAVSGTGDGSTWMDLVKHALAAQKGTFVSGALSGAMLLGAMAKNAEIMPLEGRIEHNLLLHFWPLTSLVFVPRFIDRDGGDHIGRRSKDDRDPHFAVAIPEVSDLKGFILDLPAALNGLSTDVSIFRPREGIIDLPAEGSVAFIEHMARLIPNRASSAEWRSSISAVEYFHLTKTGNNVKFLSTGRTVPRPHLAEDYQMIVGRPGEKPPYFNPLFRRGLMLAFLEDQPWYQPFGRMFSEWPWEFFCERENDDKPSRRRLATFFAADTRKKFYELKEFRMTTEDVATEKKVPRSLDIIVHDIARQYVFRRAEDKLRNADDKPINWQTDDAQRKKAEVARDAFLALRSRRDQAFIEHFTNLFGQFGQYLPAPDEFLIITSALHDNTDRVKTVALLALSANSYVSRKKETEEENKA